MDEFDYLAQVYGEARQAAGITNQEKIDSVTNYFLTQLEQMRSAQTPESKRASHETTDEKEPQIIDKLLEGGSYSPASTPKMERMNGIEQLKTYWSMMEPLSYHAQEVPQDEYWREQAGKYKTAAWWMLLYLLLLLVLQGFGCSAIWELVGLLL